MNIPADTPSLTDRIKENAYTLLFNTVASLGGLHKPLRPSAEYTHQPKTADPLFNDSYYFNFFDTDNSVSGFTRIGRLPNQNSVNGILFIFNGPKEVLMLNQGSTLPAGSDDIRAGIMHYEILEPLDKIRLISSGNMLRLADPAILLNPEELWGYATPDKFVPVDLDITFSGLGPVHNFKNIYFRGLARRMIEKNFGLSDLRKVRRVASSHYEQVGGYQGRITIGDKAISVGGTGHRDHSWGLRDWAAPKGWTWLTMQFGQALGLNLSRVIIDKIDMFNGYITRDGKNYLYRTCDIETEFEADGITQKEIRFTVEDTEGFRMTVEGRVMNVVPLTHDDGQHRIQVNEALTEYRWQDRVTYGISEYLHKIK